MGILNKAMLFLATVMLGVCVGNGLFAFTKGDIFSVLVMFVLAVMNLLSIALISILEGK